jgi:hypothetical protein
MTTGNAVRGGHDDTTAGPCPVCADRPPTTWADGFGVWHAVVTDGPDAAARARAAIRRELRERDAIGKGHRVTLERVGYVTGTMSTRVEYRERVTP